MRLASLQIVARGIFVLALLLTGSAAIAATEATAKPSTGGAAVTAATPTVKSPQGGTDTTSHDSTLIARDKESAPSSDVGIAVPKYDLEMPRVLAALAAVIGLIFLLRAGARRMFDIPVNQRSSRAVQVLSRTIVAPKQQVLLLQVGKRMVVVGDSGGQMNALCQIDDPDEVAALLGQVREEKLASAGKTFGLLFNRTKDQMVEAETDEPRETANEDAMTMEANSAEGREIFSTRQELSGLMEKVRIVSRQFHNGQT
jgi:flagellar protein FliO/FliZ